MTLSDAYSMNPQDSNYFCAAGASHRGAERLSSGKERIKFGTGSKFEATFNFPIIRLPGVRSRQPHLMLAGE